MIVEGDGLGVVLIGKRVTINVAGSGRELQVEVVDPAGHPVPTSQQGSSTFSYTPNTVGEHLIHIYLRGKAIPGSPFRAAVFNPEAIRVKKVPSGVVGRPVEIDIDGRGAGPGHLAILVDGGRVTSQVKALGDHRFKAVFVPHEAGEHQVDMSFNGVSVGGSPWRINVLPTHYPFNLNLAAPPAGASPIPPERSGSALRGRSASPMVSRTLHEPVKHVRLGKPALFEIPVPPHTHSDDIDVTVLGPNRHSVPFRLLPEDRPGLYTLEFHPTEVGSHHFEVAASGRRVFAGVAKAYNARNIRVSEVAPGVVGQTVSFKVDAAQAGEGQLEISVNDGELPNQVKVLGGGVCLVSFSPEEGKVHWVDIKFNGDSVPGCPIRVDVAGKGQVSVALQGLDLVPVHETARFQIKVDDTSQELSVAVKAPSGEELPVKVGGSVRSGFSAEFVPVQVGPHEIIVWHNGRSVPGTPFTARAFDAKRVYISPIPRAAVGQAVSFRVDASQAGEGNLEITIEGRGGRNVATNVDPLGGHRFDVKFTPVEPVDHTVRVTFNGETVPGSPFFASVSDDRGLSPVPVGKSTDFLLSGLRTQDHNDVEVAVEGPHNTNIPANFTHSAIHNSYIIQFTPTLAGEYRIFAWLRGQPLSGSPFIKKVYDIQAIKVKGLEGGTVGKPVVFQVETLNAGAGNLEVAVNNGQVPTSAEGKGPHLYDITFTPREVKEHWVEVKFNGQHVAGSPFLSEVTKGQKVAFIVKEITGKVPILREASFIIQAESNVDNEPEVKISYTADGVESVLKHQLERLDNQRYLIRWTPQVVGDHTISLFYQGIPQPNSPYTVKAYDASQVTTLNLSPKIEKDEPVSFTIDAGKAGAGNLEIIVSVAGRNVPNYVQAEGNARFRVTFTPNEEKVHGISIKFNGEPVPGSPFTCHCYSSEISKTNEIGNNKKLQIKLEKNAKIGQKVTMEIDGKSEDSHHPSYQVSVKSPSGTYLPVTIKEAFPEKVVQASFTPEEVGPHTITVSGGNKEKPRGPETSATVNVYDPSKVKVLGLDERPKAKDKEVTFTVDAAKAGEGTLELVVTTEQGSLKAEVVGRKRGEYDVTFVPKEEVEHFVYVSFNGEELPQSPWKVGVLSSMEPPKKYESIGNDFDPVLVGTTTFLACKINETLRVSNTETGRILKVRSKPLGNDTTKFYWKPEQPGKHRVEILNQNHDLIRDFDLTAFDPLLAYIENAREIERAFWQTKDPVEIIVNTENCCIPQSELRRNGLKAFVSNGLNLMECKIEQHSISNKFFCRFKPTLPLPHKIHILLFSYPVKGSPLIVNVNPPEGQIAFGEALYLARASLLTNFTLRTNGESGRDFDVIISGPGGIPVPVRCYEMSDRNLKAEFCPVKEGQHEIQVWSEGKKEAFHCQVVKTTENVKIELNNRNQDLVTGEEIKLVVKGVDESGMIEGTLTGPQGESKPIFLAKGKLSFIPRTPGKYKLDLYNWIWREQVQGTPLVFQVLDADAIGQGQSPLLLKNNQEGGFNFDLVGHGIHCTHAGRKTSFRIETVHGLEDETKGLPAQVPKVEILTASKDIVPCNLKRISPTAYQISYIPRETGILLVQVKWLGVTSPVVKVPCVDVSKIRVIGGWETYGCKNRLLSLKTGEPLKISFNTKEAGPGELTAEVRNASEATQPQVQVGQAGKVKLLLGPFQRPGEYDLSIKFSGFELEDSPRKLAVSNEEQSMLHESSNSLMLVSHQTTRTYSPSLVSPAALVSCTGEGLRHCYLGKTAQSFIDTRRAGPGELTASCSGPSGKAAFCELYDHGDGTFTLNVKPSEPGKHQLEIMYSGDHVKLSPFFLRVVGPPDPKKVKVYGPGVEPGVLATFQSRFICDTRGAGAGQLTVRIKGPKGAFRVEMQRESQKDRTILCKFDPTEPGDYRVEVRWAGEHVPGSPFRVMIFDTEKELKGWVEGGASGPLAASSVYGSSTGYSG